MRYIKIIVIVFLVGVILYGAFWYLMKRWVIYEDHQYHNFRGDAYRGAIQIAFGEDSMFADHQKFADLLTDQFRKACLDSSMSQRYNTARGPGAKPYCILEYPPGGAFYQRHCNRMLLEYCTVLTLNPIILDYPKIKQAVLEVAADPCRFYPSTNYLKTEMERYYSLPHTDKNGRFNHEYGKAPTIRDQYIEAKEWLFCDAPVETSSYKLIIGFQGDTNDENTTIKFINP